MILELKILVDQVSPMIYFRRSLKDNFSKTSLTEMKEMPLETKKQDYMKNQTRKLSKSS
jgi:hypothetical protein